MGRDDDEPRSLRNAYLGLAVAVVLVASGLLLVAELMAQSAFQDCAAAGRRDCVNHSLLGR